MGRLGQTLLDRLERSLRRHHGSWLYHSAVGLKALNPPRGTDQDRVAPDPPLLLAPAELHLSIDGLRDQYSLTGTALPDSPHTHLMRTLADGGDAAPTDYVRRLAAGTLDFRRPRVVDAQRLRHLNERFAKAWAAAEAGPTPPVKLLRIADRNYIADGKHRAAVRAARGEMVECLDVTPTVPDSYLATMAEAMRSRAGLYSRNLFVLNHLLGAA